MSERLNNTIFEDLTPREKNILAANSTFITFNKEEMFLRFQGMIFSIYYIKKGFVKLLDKHGRLVNILKEGEIIGVNYLFNKEPLSFSASAPKDTELIQVSRNMVLRLFKSNDCFSKKLLSVYFKTTSGFINQLFKYRNTKINGSIASFFIEHSTNNCITNISKKEIAEMVGYRRESVTQVINQLIKEGLIEMSNKSFKITNRNLLENVAKFG